MEAATHCPLHALQSWMQAVVSHPLGIEAGVESDSAQAVVPMGLDKIETLICRSKSLGSVERLAVYGNAYFARLLDCLADEFPTTKQVLGDDAFAAIGMQYLQARPSRSYTLNDLGTGFPDYLRETRPADIPQRGWPDYVIDLATLERTYSEVFDGPGVESGIETKLAEHFVALTPAALQSVLPDEVPRLVLQPAPCLRLLRLDFPVHEAITAARHAQDIPSPVPSPTFLVVTRRDFIVRRAAVSEVEYCLLHALVKGACLSEALERVTSMTNDLKTDFVSGCFERWTQAQWFVGLSIDSEPNLGFDRHPED